MSVTTGMVGQGEYNRHSATQLAAIDYVTPWLDEAIAAMTLADEPMTLGLADFGCSEGQNSIAVMRRLVAAIRARTARPIQTIHSDLPTNDYSALFRALRPDGHSVFDAQDVFSAAVGGSMFDTLLPPRSIHLAMTFNAIGFLSQRPVDRLPGYILANGPSARGGIGMVSDGDHRLFARQACRDVESFMVARAAELVSGGKMMIQVFGAGEALRTCDGTFDVLNDALLEALDAGLIDRDGYEAFYHPVYFRTLDELIAPMVDDRSPCRKLFSLDRSQTYEVPVPFVEDLERTGDIEQFARAYTDFFRVFTEPVIRASFAVSPDINNLVGDIYQRTVRLIRDDPSRYELHYIALAALFTRLGGD